MCKITDRALAQFVLVFPPIEYRHIKRNRVSVALTWQPNYAKGHRFYVAP